MLTQADWIILVVVAASAVLSLIRGFIKEAISLAAWLCAFLITGNFYAELADKLTFIEDNSMRIGAAIVVLFAASMLAAGLLGAVLKAATAKAGLSGTDRLLGAVFGVLRGLLIVCAILALLQILFKLHILSSIASEPWWQDSLFIPELMRVVSWFFVYVGSPVGV